jgi:hypothetical protein
MTDRVSAFTVVLERDVREDDAQSLIEAIRHLRGILSVEPVVSNPGQAVATARLRFEYFEKLRQVLEAPL